MPENKFSERLKKLRGRVSQTTLSQLCGLKNDDAIRRYERGDAKPGMDSLEAIADYCRQCSQESKDGFCPFVGKKVIVPRKPARLAATRQARGTKQRRRSCGRRALVRPTPHNICNASPTQSNTELRWVTQFNDRGRRL